jgi:predicted heme/steroid binding protein
VTELLATLLEFAIVLPDKKAAAATKAAKKPTPIDHLEETIEIAMEAGKAMAYTKYDGSECTVSQSPIWEQLRYRKNNGIDFDDRGQLVGNLEGLQEYVLASAWQNKPAWRTVTKLLATLLEFAIALPDKKAAAASGDAIVTSVLRPVDHLEKTIEIAMEAGKAMAYTKYDGSECTVSKPPIWEQLRYRKCDGIDVDGRGQLVGNTWRACRSTCLHRRGRTSPRGAQ